MDNLESIYGWSWSRSRLVKRCSSSIEGRNATETVKSYSPYNHLLVYFCCDLELPTSSDCHIGVHFLVITQSLVLVILVSINERVGLLVLVLAGMSGLGDWA